MPRFVCTQKWFHNLHLFRIGDYFTGAEKNLPHDKEGNLVGFTEIHEAPDIVEAVIPKPSLVSVNGEDILQPKDLMSVEDVKKNFPAQG